jgi:corrinoid protein of di/trimethylamine methyltransferase
MSSEILEKLANAVITGDVDEARKVAEEALKANVDPLEAIKNGLAKGMDVIGKKFHNFEVFLPEVMLAADAMKAGIEILRPYLSAESAAKMSKGKVVIGTVFGDIHDIGKNLVAAMLEAAGFEVYDLGTDCPSTKFVEKAEEVKADIIAMSSLMVTSMFYQKEVVDFLKDAGEREKYWVMVGGGPVTPEWAKEIGADGYGRFADDAVEVAKTLIEAGDKVALPVIRE